MYVIKFNVFCGDDNIWMISILDRYLVRLLIYEFVNMCLVIFVLRYRVIVNFIYIEEVDLEEELKIEIGKKIWLFYNMGIIIRRIKKDVVIRYLKFL